MSSFQQSQSYEGRRRRGGFSLIELVIVVVIIGIIGAIAIPRMSRGAAGAADSSLKANLAVLRNAIDLYAAEHGGAYPAIGSLTLALTGYSDVTGADLDLEKDEPNGRIYGPYLRSIPPIPVGLQKGNAEFTASKDSAPTSASKAWYYDAATGSIFANTGTTLADVSGKLYSDY